LTTWWPTRSEGPDQAAVDQDVGTGDVAGPSPGEQQNYIGDFLQVGEAAGRRAGDGLFGALV
jgi:hypothetical protein